MTALLQRPDPRRVRARPSPSPARTETSAVGSLLVALLVASSLVGFTRVFATSEWIVPLLLAGLAPVLLSWVTRRLGSPWPLALFVAATGWLWYTAVTLLPSTLWAGVVPTPSTLAVMADAAALATERIAVLPAPVYPEIPLLLLAVTGVWWVATSIDTLALRLRSPGKAVICAVTLWVVPLAIVPDGRPPWMSTTPLLLAAVGVMLYRSDHDLLAWGQVVRPQTGYLMTVNRRPSGIVLAIGAVVIGAAVAALLPGFGDPPWYQVRAQATTLTGNPIVQLRTNLVASDQGPILRVRSQRPVYLRSTALDRYAATEEWTASAITPRPLQGERVPGGIVTRNRNEVRVEVIDLEDAVLVPTPAGPTRFVPPDGVQASYDQRTSTMTFGDERLHTGQRYEVVARTPEIRPATARSAAAPAPPRLTALPAGVPPEVRNLASSIVDDADARTPFDQALAIQNELRTWEYSLSPPPGHSGVAMRTFLEQRVGYCEQFAATMAVMLRMRDIPARVAVGFTPGTVDPDDPTLWTVSWANAHAWVEVLLNGQWIAFEPTPRTDGNVLVPTAADVAPVTTTVRPDRTSDEADRGAGQADQEQFDRFDEREALANRRDAAAADASTPQGGRGGVTRRLTDPALVVAVVAGAVLILVLLAGVGRRRGATTTPQQRILAVGELIGRTGRGVGRIRTATETDAEYLTRIGGHDPATTIVADALTRARYAPTVDADLATAAEQAADRLTATLMETRPTWQRPLLRVRGDCAAGWSRIREQVAGQRSFSPRRRRSWK